MSGFVESTLSVGPFQCNCKVIVCPTTGEAAIVDPGDEAPKILQRVAELENSALNGKPLRIRYLIHTHGHLDHIAATGKILESLSASQEITPLVCLHRGDLDLYNALAIQSQMFGLNYKEAPAPTLFLEDNQVLELGNLRIECRHTPGHSPGSVCLKLDGTLLSGDTLFQGSVGRTDLWGGDWDTLESSIRNRIFTLEDEIRVCPGHGPDTLIGIEKRSNPFLT